MRDRAAERWAAAPRRSRGPQALTRVVDQCGGSARGLPSRLLRGQRGTEGEIGNPASAAARNVVLDEALVPLPVSEAALGLEANWRFGPASKPVSARSYRPRPSSPTRRSSSRMTGIRPAEPSST